MKDAKDVYMAMKDSLGSSHNKKKKNTFKKTKQGKTKVGKGKNKGKDKCFLCGKKPLEK